MPRKKESLMQLVVGQFQRRSSRLAEKQQQQQQEQQPSSPMHQEQEEQQSLPLEESHSSGASVSHVANWANESSLGVYDLKASVALKSGLLLPKSGTACPEGISPEPEAVTDISGLWGLLPEEVRHGGESILMRDS